MDTILAVSSSYLDPLYENAQQYNFKLQAYSDFKNAIKGLSYVNKTDLIGIAIVDDHIRDKEGLELFLHSCDIVGDLNILFAVLRDEKIFYSLKVKNLHVEFVPDIEVFTDIIINREIFGTLLLHKFKPYKLKETVQDTTKHHIPRLSYTPLVSVNVTNILKPVDLIHSYEQCIETDEFLLECKRSNRILYELRLLYLKNWYGQDKNSDYVHVYNEIIKTDSDELFCQYISLMELIKGGEI